MNKLLLVEDAETLREVLAAVLEREGFEVTPCASGEEALAALEKNQFGCVIADFKLPGINGIELLTKTREISTSVPFVLMTAYGSIEIAVEAMRLGANDFVTKPFEPQIFCALIHQILEHRQIIDRATGIRTRRERAFMTQDPALRQILDQARKVARVDTTALILGESGTGKELLARYLHEHSPRRDKPFVAVNCAALPAELLESEFFGNEAGAFTGATQTRVGVFEYAAEGTIFLDEIGDMPLPLQVKLLRALQEGEIKRLGSNRIIKVDPRIIAATNHDVEKALDRGTLREDFYYRIAVVTLTIPPLRRRNGDIELLVDYFVDYFCAKMGKEKLPLQAEALEFLKRYPWPGNARELENVIERAVILAEQAIGVEHLGLRVNLDFQSLADAAVTLPEIANRAAREAEIEHITRILNQTMGNKTKAAQILGVSYKTLLNKVKEYDIRLG